jgi:hypothetical protein
MAYPGSLGDVGNGQQWGGGGVDVGGYDNQTPTEGVVQQIEEEAEEVWQEAKDDVQGITNPSTLTKVVVGTLIGATALFALGYFIRSFR